MTQEKVVVLGVGNILLGDEGVGCHTITALTAQPLPSHVRCVDGGTGGLHLLSEIEGATEVVLVDAVCDGNPVGSVTRLTPKFASDYPRTLVAHDIGLKDLLEVLSLSEPAPAVTLFAVSIEPPADLTLDLSEALRAALPGITEAIRSHLLESA